MLKKSIPILVILTLLSSPVFSKGVEKNTTLNNLEAYFDAWKSRDIKKISKFFAKNISVYDLPSDSTISGKEKVTKHMQEAWLAAVPDVAWFFTSTPTVTGNNISYEWVYTGTYSGMWWKTKVDNKPFSIKGMSTTVFDKAGKITMQRDFYDIKSFESQLGL